jgi:hypothetical protein
LRGFVSVGIAAKDNTQSGRDGHGILHLGNRGVCLGRGRDWVVLCSERQGMERRPNRRDARRSYRDCARRVLAVSFRIVRPTRQTRFNNSGIAGGQRPAECAFHCRRCRHSSPDTRQREETVQSSSDPFGGNHCSRGKSWAIPTIANRNVRSAQGPDRATVLPGSFRPSNCSSPSAAALMDAHGRGNTA